MGEDRSLWSRLRTGDSQKSQQLNRAATRGSGLVVIALLSVAPLLAQNAEISGLITDPSNLAVPGAHVVVQSADTGATRTVSSNQQGEYSVPALLPGPYNITVEANGFKTIQQNGIVVEVDQRARLDFALTVGTNTETITVQGSAPLLNTSDASVSTLIGNQFVENMPLNGRSFSSLIDLTPGVVLTPANFYAVRLRSDGPFQHPGHLRHPWPSVSTSSLRGSAKLEQTMFASRRGRSVEDLVEKGRQRNAPKADRNIAN